MKDINGTEITVNSTVRWRAGKNYSWDEYVIDGVSSNVIAMHNVFGPVVLLPITGEFEVLPERMVTKDDFKRKLNE